MELNVRTFPPRTVYDANTTLSMAEGDRMQIRRNPPTENLLYERVPDGKKWEVNIVVHITETDL